MGLTDVDRGEQNTNLTEVCGGFLKHLFKVSQGSYSTLSFSHFVTMDSSMCVFLKHAKKEKLQF